jgi:hypothetical protein
LHDQSLEFFRPNHGREQICEEQERNNPDDECFHLVLLQFLAKADVKCGHNEEEDYGSDENDVGHYFAFGCSQTCE